MEERDNGLSPELIAEILTAVETKSASLDWRDRKQLAHIIYLRLAGEAPLFPPAVSCC